MRRRVVIVAIAVAGAVLPAVLAPDSLGRSERRADVTTVAIPGAKVLAAPALRVGRRYKMVLRGTGSSRQGVAPDFDWFYCFQPTCKGGIGASVWLVYFCDQEPSTFGVTTGPIP